MGIQPYPRFIQRKRRDYELSEIEKKYSEEDLTKLILVSYIRNYDSLNYNPERLCQLCKNNKATEKMQISGYLLCDECYKKEKEENFKEMLNIFSERKLKFEGDIIIDNKLILGSIESSYLKDKLKELGVTHILMIGFFMTPIYPSDFIYENYEVNDDSSENILQYLVDGVRFIENSKVCYCHCQLGKSRSASFVIAYAMYKNRIHFSPAFDLVKKKRKLIFPNEGFQCQLEDFDIILSNFDYDLNKCDEFIKKFMKEKDKLKDNDEYVIKAMRELRRRRKYSNTEYDSDGDEIKRDIDNDESDSKNEKKEDKELPLKENEEKNEEKKDNELQIKEVEVKEDKELSVNIEGKNEEKEKEKEKEEERQIEKNENKD